MLILNIKKRLRLFPFRWAHYNLELPYAMVLWVLKLLKRPQEWRSENIFHIPEPVMKLQRYCFVMLAHVVSWSTQHVFGWLPYPNVGQKSQQFDWTSFHLKHIHLGNNFPRTSLGPCLCNAMFAPWSLTFITPLRWAWKYFTNPLPFFNFHPPQAFRSKN